LISNAYGAEKIGSVVEIKGIAEALRADGIIKLNINDPIFEKDTLRTRANSLLKIKFNDEKLVILTEKTKITIDSYSNNKEISAIRGGIRNIVDKLKIDETYKIKTTTAIAGIRGTDFAVLSFGNETVVYVFDGIVNVVNQFGSVDVNKGFHTFVFLNQPPQIPIRTPDDKSKQIKQLFNIQNQMDINKIKELEPVIQDEKGGSKDVPPVVTPVPPNIPPSELNPKTLQPPKPQHGPIDIPYQPPGF
jgi:hypothetical protein